MVNIEKFKKLGIADEILRVIEEEKFEDPTEIQEKAIPVVLNGQDVIATAKTGSGKTLVFCARIIQNAVKGNGIQALVLTPTRELAEQVAMAIKKFSRYKGIRTLAVYGGVAIGPQIDNLQYADVVVGTPGRILDHLERGTVNFGNVNMLVLDEADRMLDMGFIDDVKRIISQCQNERQTMLFSATIPPEIQDLIKGYMSGPVKITATKYVDPTKLTQFYYDVQENQKISLLAHLLKKEKTGLVMVFCNTQKMTQFVAKNLKGAGVDAIGIHGGLSQNKRKRIFEYFNSNKAQVLVCTDVAARGLDIPGVTHVYNFSAPNDENQYIHRIGRTARAEKEGMAINLISERDYDNFSRIMRYSEANITKLALPEFERISLTFSMSRRMAPQGGERFYGRQGHGGPRRFGQGGGGQRSGGNRGSYGQRREESSHHFDGETHHRSGPESGSRDSSQRRPFQRSSQRPQFQRRN